MPNATMRQIWDDFGKDVTVKLMKNYSGIPIVPPKRSFLKYIERKIKAEFTGDNIHDLVRKYDVSMSYIYGITKKSSTEN